MKLDFESELPENKNSYDQHFSTDHENSIETEIKKLFSKEITETFEQKIVEYITNFYRTKSSLFYQINTELEKIKL